MNKVLRTVAVIALLSCAGSLPASEAPEGERPRIGLVLSGGGARGIAHVGVLKVIEELNIPIDMVAGTSMGAIVGGLYAAGLSPAEMEEILAEVDWRRLLDDQPDRRFLPYRRKVDDQTFLAKFEAGFNRGKIELPSGLISGQQLDFAIQVMAMRTAGITDFDDLPIPFRAIATDLQNGDMVVLGSGDLGRAVRASMSIPAVFAPVEIDGRLLIDGGLSRNLPVDVARSMGADVIIAVDVGQPLGETSKQVSLAGMTGHLIGLQIERNTRQQLDDADVLIRPELGGLSSADFEKALLALPGGVEAARAQSDELRVFAIDGAEYEARMQHMRRQVSMPETITSIQLDLAPGTDPEFILDRVSLRPGDPFDLDAIRHDLLSLYQTGDFQKVNFFLTREGDELIVHVKVQEKPWGPNYLRFGVNVFSDFEGDSSMDLLSSYTMTRLNRLRAEFKLNLQLGEHPSIKAEFYQPLTTSGQFFVAPWASQYTDSTYTPVEGGTWAKYRSKAFEGGLDLGLQFGRFGEVRLGIVKASGEAKLQTGGGTVDPTLPSHSDLDFGGYRCTAVIDQFDNMNFPRNGYLVSAGYFRVRESLGAAADFELASIQLGGATSWRKHTLLSLVNMYSALDTESPVVGDLGGLFRLSGYSPGTIAGRYGGNASLLYLYRFAQLPPGFGGGIYLGGSVETGNMWFDRDQVSGSDLLWAGSLVVGIDTVLGPLYLAQGFGEGGADATYFFIGRSF